MLTKKQILPVGSTVSVRFSDEEAYTNAIIIGHLTLKRGMVSRFDYTCVSSPGGVEDGVFYINHDDIVEVLHRGNDQGKAYYKWIERKYAEYLSYYKNYGQECRPSIEEVRRAIHEEKIDSPPQNIKWYNGIIAISGMLCSALLSALIMQSWLAGVGAALCFTAGYVIKRIYK